MQNEIDRLDNIARDSWYAKGVSKKMIEYSASIFFRHMIDGSVLELGPAEGIATELLSKRFKNVTVVEGSSHFCDPLKKRLPQVTVVNSLIENYEPGRQFDNIIMGHVLEHVEDPVQILRHVRNWLSPQGRLLCAVPNSHSIHRQAAVIMGLLTYENELNSTDLHHGHRRVYNQASLKSDFLQAELKIEKMGGYWLKPLSNFQIDNEWNEDMIDAFMILGEQYPEIAAEMYIVASR